MNAAFCVRKMVVGTALGILLTCSGFMLAGCAGPSDSSKAETPTSSNSSPSTNSNSAESDEISLKDLEAAMTEAYMGLTDSGEGFYYAGNEDGSLVIIMAANTSGDVVSFVGPTETSGNMMTVTDEVSELSLTFSVEPQSNGTLILDMGPEGKATVAPCEVSEVLDLMNTLDIYGNAVA